MIVKTERFSWKGLTHNLLGVFFSKSHDGLYLDQSFNPRQLIRDLLVMILSIESVKPRVIQMGVCISQPPALAPNLCLTAQTPNLYLPALAPSLYLPALAYNFITSPGPEFAYTNLVSSICICIYGPGLRFVLPVRGLNLHLPYYW